MDSASQLTDIMTLTPSYDQSPKTTAVLQGGRAGWESARVSALAQFSLALLSFQPAQLYETAISHHAIKQRPLLPAQGHPSWGEHV